MTDLVSQGSSKAQAVFVATGRGNWVARGEGFYVSFKPSGPISVANMADEMFLDFAALLANESNEDAETALYDRATDTWYILRGDFCNHYAPVIANGLEACLAVYRQFAPRYRSGFSTDDVPLLASGTDR